MAAKGSLAKTIVEKKIAEVFGQDYLGINDKKLYVQCKENGEMVQIAITLTCPKTAVDFGNTSTITPEVEAVNGGWDWGSVPTTPASVPHKAEITEDELRKIAELREKFNL